MSESTEANLGIITALPVECAAMRAMIDQPRTERHRLNDPNDYLTGTVLSSRPGEPHKVVLTVMPRDNNKNAAAVCVDLLRTYPTIRRVVMVGIAGGVPMPASPDRHIRLGDVVVATEGVIDYDHVRHADGAVDIRRHLQGMSMNLLRATQQLRVDEHRGSRPWLEALRRVDGLDQYRRPPAGTDQLFVDGSYVAHPDRSLTGHPLDGPKVHYAAVASGDRLLRDSHYRDDLARRHNVVAIEMEGSGVASAADLHGASWFVVRGIADYCDNQTKSDRWHPYASIAAAAYAQALLGNCPPTPVTPVGLIQPQPQRRHDRMEQVRLLLEIPSIADSNMRQAIIELLRPDIRDNIRRFSSARADVYQILSTCLDYPNGIEDLKAAIIFIAGDANSVRRAFEALDVEDLF